MTDVCMTLAVLS